MRGLSARFSRDQLHKINTAPSTTWYLEDPFWNIDLGVGHSQVVCETLFVKYFNVYSTDRGVVGEWPERNNVTNLVVEHTLGPLRTSEDS